MCRETALGRHTQRGQCTLDDVITLLARIMLLARLLVALPLARSLSADFPTGFSRVVVASGTSCYANTVGPALVRDWIEAGVDVTLLTRKVDIARAPLPVGNQYGHLAIGPSLVARTRFRRWTRATRARARRRLPRMGGGARRRRGRPPHREVSGSTELEVGALARAIGACAKRPKALVTLAPADGVAPPAARGQAARASRPPRPRPPRRPPRPAACGPRTRSGSRASSARLFGGSTGSSAAPTARGSTDPTSRCIAHVASGGAVLDRGRAPSSASAAARALDTAAAAEGAAKLTSSLRGVRHRDGGREERRRTAPAVGRTASRRRAAAPRHPPHESTTVVPWATPRW